MREIAFFIGSLAGAAVLTALAVLIRPESPLWKALLWGGTAVFVACACVLLFDYFRPGGKTLLLIGAAIGIALFVGCGIALFADTDPLARDKVQIKIKNVVFDPNGPNEIYADFLLLNAGEPTILRNWTLSALAPDGEKLDRVTPRWMHTKVTFVPSGPPIEENLALTPLEKGGAREGRLTYTHDLPTKRIFGQTGTRFVIRTDDVTGHTIEAKYVL
jgi:hypothetical protein